MNIENLSRLPYITLPQLNLKILIDTGSSKSFINPEIVNKYFPNKVITDPFWVKTAHGTSKINFSSMVPCGELFKIPRLNLKFGIFKFHNKFDMLLGLENLIPLGASVNLKTCTLETPNVEIPMFYLDTDQGNLHLLDPRSIQQVKLKINNIINGDAIIPYTKAAFG